MDENEMVITKESLTNLMTKITESIGFGFQESIYQNALDYELRNHLFEVQQEVNIDVVYGLYRLGSVRADLIVNNNTIIEMKTLDRLKPKATSQLERYMKLLNIKKGFVINISYQNFEIEELSI